MYKETDLKSWDYVLAVSQKEINKCLKEVFDEGLLMEKEQVFDMPLLGENGVLKLTFAAVSIEAKENALKLCDVRFSISRIESIVGEKTEQLVRDVSMILTTSLASLSAKREGNVEQRIILDINNDDVVYNVMFEGQGGMDQEFLSRLIRKTLLKTNLNSFVLSGISLGEDQKDQTIPTFAEFSFVRNAQNPGQSALIMATSVAPGGPIVDNRLFFDSNILQNGLPAMYWVGNQLLFEKIIKPASDKTLKKLNDADGVPGSVVIDNNRMVRLSEHLVIPEDRCHASLTGFVVETADNALNYHTTLSLKKLSKGWIYDADFFATYGTWAKSEFFLTDNKQGFWEEFKVVKNHVEKSDNDPMGYLGWFNPIHGHSKTEAEKDMQTAADNLPVESFLESCVGNINSNAKNIPALARLMIGDKLAFNGMSIHNNGTICIGIEYPP